MTARSFPQLASELLPEDARPWVVAALRNDPVIWDELQKPAMLAKLEQRTSSKAGFHPADWSPGALALLAMDMPFQPDHLHDGALPSPIDPQIQQQANQSLADFLNHAGPLTLAQAGWVALAWQQRLRRSDRYFSLLEELRLNPQASWRTPLACLYGLVALPSALLELLFAPENTSNIHHLGLHVILSTPLLPEEQVEILIKHTCGEAFKPCRLSPAKQLHLLLLLSLRQPDLAADYSRRRLEMIHQDHRRDGWSMTAGQITPGRLETPILLAELNRLAGNIEQALAFYKAAQEGGRYLLAGLHDRWAAIAAQADSTARQARLSAWKEAVELTHPETTGSPSSPYLARLITQLIEENRLEEARMLLPPQDDWFSADLGLLLAAATLAIQEQNRQAAEMYLGRAMEIALSPDDPAELTGPESFWLRPNLEKLIALCERLDLRPEAASLTRKLLSLCPNDPDLLILLSKNLSSDQAITVLQTAALLAPDHPDLHHLLATRLEEAGAYTQALQEHQVFIRQIQAHGAVPTIEAWLSLARCALQANQPQITLQVCRNILEQNPEQGMACFYCGEACARLNDAEGAIQHLTRATQLLPEQPLVWLSLAQAQNEQGQAQQALETLRTAAQTLPDEPRIQLALGNHYLALHSPTLALPALRQAAHLNPADQGIALLLGQTLDALGYHAESRQVLSEAYQRGLHNPPDLQNADLSYTYAQILLADQDYLAAISALENAIQLRKDLPPQAWVDLGRAILILLGTQESSCQNLLPSGSSQIARASSVPLSPSVTPQRAAEALQHALKFFPTDEEVLTLYAEALLACENYPEAFQVYQRALEAKADQNTAQTGRLQFGLGKAALALGQYETAIAAFQEAARHQLHSAAQHTRAVIYRHLSDAYWATNLRQEAHQAARLALDACQDDADWALWFARQVSALFVEQNTYPPSVSERTDPQPTNKLSIHASARPVIQEVLEVLERTVLLHPQRTDVLLSLGQWRLRTGHSQQAIQTFQAVLEHDHASSADLRQAGKALLELEQPDQAIAALKKAALLEKTSGDKTSNLLLFEIAQAYRASGHLIQALELLEQASGPETEPPYPSQFFCEKAEILLAMRQPGKALACLEQGIAQTAEQADRPALQALIRLHYLAAVACRILGNPVAALHQVHSGLQKCQELSAKAGNEAGAFEFTLTLLQAELYRALIQPEKAFQLISQLGKRGPLACNGCPDTSLLATCLPLELSLEAGETPKNYPEFMSGNDQWHNHPRLLALQIRLVLRQPNKIEKDFSHILDDLDKRFRQAYETSLNRLKEQEIPTDLSSAEQPIQPQAPLDNPIEEALAVIECGLELQAWDDAISLINHLKQRAPAEPRVHLAEAQAMIMRAEYQHLCNETDVYLHAPGENALSAASRKAFLEGLQTTNQILNNWRSQGEESLDTLDTLPQNPILVRWYRRGQAAFLESNPNTAEPQKIFHQINAAIHDRSTQPFSYGPQDAAAFLAALRRLNRSLSGIEASQGIPELNSAAWFKTLLRIARPYPKASRVLLEIALAFEKSNPDQAIQAALRAAKALANGSPEATPAFCYAAIVQALLARLSYSRRDHATAKQAIEAALQIWPDEPRWQILAAKICTDRGAVTQAIAHLEAALQKEPTRLETYLALARAYRAGYPKQRDALERAIEALRQAAKLAPKTPQIWLELGTTQLEAGHFAQAAQSARQALRHAKGQNQEEPYIKSALLLAEASIKTGDLQAALENAQNAYLSQATPRLHAKSAALLAQVLLQQKEPDRALEILEQAACKLTSASPTEQADEASLEEQSDPIAFSDPIYELKMQRAALLKEQRGNKAALDAYKELAKLYPDRPQVFAYLARIFAEENDLASAIQACQHAIRLESAHPLDTTLANLHLLCGHYQRLTGQLDQAIHHLNTAAQLTPENVQVHLELGMARRERREYDQAIQAFQQAIALDPANANLYYQAGLALKESKDYRAAESLLRRAASLEPTNVNIRKQLAAVAALNLVHNPHSARLRVEQR